MRVNFSTHRLPCPGLLLARSQPATTCPAAIQPILNLRPVTDADSRTAYVRWLRTLKDPAEASRKWIAFSNLSLVLFAGGAL